MAFDALEQANQSLYGPSEPRKPQGWASQFPYSYEPGSVYGTAPGGLSPERGSMYGPTTSAVQPPATPASTMPQYSFGGSEGDDGGAANAANARAIGQSVLASSQAATKKKGIGGMGGGMGGISGT